VIQIIGDSKKQTSAHRLLLIRLE